MNGSDIEEALSDERDELAEQVEVLEAEQAETAQDLQEALADLEKIVEAVTKQVGFPLALNAATNAWLKEPDVEPEEVAEFLADSAEGIRINAAIRRSLKEGGA